MLQIKLKIKQTHVGYKCLETVSILECVFADDLVGFAKNRSELKYNLMLRKEALKKSNMNINIEKMKIMILGGEESVEMEVEGIKLEQVEGIKLEQVKSFKYLGVQTENNRKYETDINEKISTPMKTYYTLDRNFPKMTVITKNTKIDVYRMIFCPIFIWGCESWVLTKEIESRLRK